MSFPEPSLPEHLQNRHFRNRHYLILTSLGPNPNYSGSDGPGSDGPGSDGSGSDGSWSGWWPNYSKLMTKNLLKLYRIWAVCKMCFYEHHQARSLFLFFMITSQSSVRRMGDNRTRKQIVYSVHSHAPEIETDRGSAIKTQPETNPIANRY